MTFNYMVYMFYTRKGYFSIILGAIHRESFRLTEMHKLSLKDADLHVSLYVFLYVPGLHLKWPWGPSVTLKLFVLIPSCYMPSYIVLGSMVPELHDICIVYLLKAVTPAWVTNTVSFTLKIDYIHHSGSFEVLQAKVNVYYRSGSRVRSRAP